MENQSELGMKHIGFLALMGIVFTTILVLTIGKPEKEGFEKEIKRLNQIENKVVESISNGEKEKALGYILQLNWQYNPSSVGGIQKANKYTENWNLKRRNYLIAIGEDPDKYQFSNENKTSLKNEIEKLKIK
jgi:hypothetical protein